MPDFYVNGTRGDDLAPGTYAQPVKTIFRATELAAEMPGGSGTIYVEPGIYDLASGENFPLLVPPRYGLEGTGFTDLPIIRYDGRARGSDGIVPFWNNVVLVAGTAVRNIVMEADPYTDIPPCTTMNAMQTIEDGVTVENVELRARSLDINDGFGFGIYGVGNRGLIQGIRFRAGGSEVLWEGGSCTLRRSSFDTAGAYFGDGDHTIETNTFVNAFLGVRPSTNARIFRNSFRDSAIGGGVIWVHGPPGTAADGPFIEDNVIRDCRFGISCEGRGTARFRRNSVERFSNIGVWIHGGSSPVFENNNRIRMPTDRFALVLKTGSDAFPSFEDTVFDSKLASPTGGRIFAMTGIELRSPVDFGGGGRSRGNNSFGMVYSWPIADIPGGGVIKAHNNLWPYYYGRLFNAAPGTVVEYDGARLDPDGWTAGR